MEEIFLRNIESAQYIYAAKKNFIRKSAISESDSKILIGHFSDIHGDIKRFENVIKYFEHFNVDFGLHTGDLVTWNTSDDFSFFYDKIKNLKIPVYNCIGNHDTFNSQGVNTNEFLHNQFISPLKNINYDNKKAYYFVDFEKYMIRLIVLNNYDNEETDWHVRDKYTLSQEQCDWLVDTLKSAQRNGFGVIIASHESDEEVAAGSNNFGFCQNYSPYPWGLPRPKPTIVSDIVNAFKHGQRFNNTYNCEGIGDPIEINADFKNRGEFICYLNGHRHGDYVGYLNTYPDQLSICMTCSGCYPDNYHNIGEECSDLPRIPDTVTEDAVNFYSIDRESKMISIIRVGATINNEFKKRIALQLKY